MSSQLGIWHIKNQQPIRLRRSQISLESHLEDWIEAQPQLIQHGLVIVGRQVHCDGGIIDLLAVNPYRSSWMVIELKRDNVRRKTIGQVLDYASSIARMSSDQLKNIVNNYLKKRGDSLQRLLNESTIQEDMFSNDRVVQTVVVGTGQNADLSRIVDYLSEHTDIDIAVVEFEVFEGEDSEISLVRQLTEQDMSPVSDEESDETLARLFKLADDNGIGSGFRRIYDTCVEHGLYPRLYKWSIMYTPQQHKGRCLVVAWVTPTYDKLQVYAIPETFAEYFPVSENEAMEIIGDGERKLLSAEEVPRFIEDINTLFDRIHKNQ